MMENPPLSLADVLEQEYAELHPEAPMVIDGQVSPSERLAAIHKALHKSPDPHVALCLSGGGIRSATFGLGVLQVRVSVHRDHLDRSIVITGIGPS